jgi:hypothetical protein
MQKGDLRFPARRDERVRRPAHNWDPPTTGSRYGDLSSVAPVTHQVSARFLPANSRRTATDGSPPYRCKPFRLRVESRKFPIHVIHKWSYHCQPLGCWHLDLTLREGRVQRHVTLYPLSGRVARKDSCFVAKLLRREVARRASAGRWIAGSCLTSSRPPQLQESNARENLIARNEGERN